MGIKQLIEADIKTAMLSGEKERASILRIIKSAILDVEIAQGKRVEGLPEADVISVLSKEAKKRQDAVDLYTTAGEVTRAQNEAAEKEIITSYLPAQISDEELEEMVARIIRAQQEPLGPQLMGKIIASVRDQAQGKADGSRIAVAVKNGLATK